MIVIGIEFSLPQMPNPKADMDEYMQGYYDAQQEEKVSGDDKWRVGLVVLTMAASSTLTYLKVVDSSVFTHVVTGTLTYVAGTHQSRFKDPK